MKQTKSKKKIPKIRREWIINPRPRIKESGKIYRRHTQKQSPVA